MTAAHVADVAAARLHRVAGSEMEPDDALRAAVFDRAYDPAAAPEERERFRQAWLLIDRDRPLIDRAHLARFLEVQKPKAGPVLDADSPDAEKEPAAAGPRFRRAAEVVRDPAPAAIVEGIAWADCITVLAAESGAGKTFYALGAAAAVADGVALHGRETRRGSVAYVSFEGDALGLRLQAQRDAGLSLEGVYILRAGDPLSPRVERDGVEARSLGEAALTASLASLAAELVAAGRPPIVLLILDTVRASLAGSEDSSEHVSAYLRAVRRIMATVPGAACILAHHSGWQDNSETRRKRERGSSAFRGNVDATLYLEVVEEDPENRCAYLELRALKVRDAERPAPLRLVRRRVEVLATGDHGEPLTSCVIERDTRTLEDRENEAAAAQADEERQLDAAVLVAMHEHRPTSLDRLRLLVRGKRDTVYEAVGRVLRGHLAAQARRGEPYTLTPAGLAVAGLDVPSSPSSPTVPASSPGRSLPIVPPSPPLGGRGRGRSRGIEKGETA